MTRICYKLTAAVLLQNDATELLKFRLSEIKTDLTMLYQKLFSVIHSINHKTIKVLLRAARLPLT